ncbi:hypothetical protein ASD38_08975 [Caulobacter sp. Root487D2Y]|uniref:hypothetical protein n=1 Tax=Caulobacter sp. Root487D2Y TaxID=1736547 RepID=UPI0006F58022|nr:hypothetical protein [Caulobacter sp. Root487D2Y]KQY29470.1 hypothetical protein ASD38_08975 [Caulobacter sp. Root487D2Y]
MTAIRWEVLEQLVKEARNGGHDLIARASLYAAADAFATQATRMLLEDGASIHDAGFGYLGGFLSNFAIGLGFGSLDAPGSDPLRFIGIADEDLYKARGQFAR